MSDRILVKWRERRGGVWVPEDRLRATLLGAGLLVPGSLILFALVMMYVEGIPGIALILVLLFLNGLGVRATVYSISLEV